MPVRLIPEWERRGDEREREREMRRREERREKERGNDYLSRMRLIFIKYIHPIYYVLFLVFSTDIATGGTIQIKGGRFPRETGIGASGRRDQEDD